LPQQQQQLQQRAQRGGGTGTSPSYNRAAHGAASAPYYNLKGSPPSNAASAGASGGTNARSPGNGGGVGRQGGGVGTSPERELPSNFNFVTPAFPQMPMTSE
jgi:hypothetical protein